MNDLSELFRNARSAVFFGGAGVSTESGIPDFRSEDGLYRQKYDVPPEVMLSAETFRTNRRKFFSFYRDKMLPLWAKPNPAHLKLAELERAGKLSAVVTQNIDGLHQAAGSKRVYELHGSIHRNYCMRCARCYPAEFIAESKGIPRCECGGVIKPDVVLYGEPLNEIVVRDALRAIERADLLVVAGTSLTVSPAAGFVEWFGGDHLVLINRTETYLDDRCDLVIRENVGEVFSKITL